MPNRSELIINHLTQAKATSPSYGKTPEDFRVVCKTFMADLERFEPDVVDSSFNEWRHENSEFPHPSDIVKICTRIQATRYSCHKQAVQDTLQIGNRVKETRTQEDKDEIAELLSGIKAQHAEVQAEKRKANSKPNYSHWDRHTDEQKAEFKENLIRARHKLLGQGEL